MTLERFKALFRSKPVAPAGKKSAEPLMQEFTISMPRAMIVSAKEISLMVEQENQHASSEAKHAMCFARLSRIYPEASKRDIGLAIELGIRS